MTPQKRIKARFTVEASHFNKVKVGDHHEQLSWFHSEGRSVNLVVTQKIVGNKLTKPRVLAKLTSLEGEEQVKAIYRDYVRRHGPEGQDPWPLPQMKARDLSIDEDIELGSAQQPSMFGAAA